MVHLGKEEGICQFVHEAAPESAKVTSVVRNEAEEKVEKWLNSWIHEIVTNKIKCNGQHCETESQVH